LKTLIRVVSPGIRNGRFRCYM